MNSSGASDPREHLYQAFKGLAMVAEAEAGKDRWVIMTSYRNITLEVSLANDRYKNAAVPMFLLDSCRTPTKSFTGGGLRKFSPRGLEDIVLRLAKGDGSVPIADVVDRVHERAGRMPC